MKSRAQNCEEVPFKNVWADQQGLKCFRGHFGRFSYNFWYPNSFWNSKLFGAISFCRGATLTIQPLEGSASSARHTSFGLPKKQASGDGGKRKKGRATSGRKTLGAISGACTDTDRSYTNRTQGTTNCSYISVGLPRKQKIGVIFSFKNQGVGRMPTILGMNFWGEFLGGPETLEPQDRKIRGKDSLKNSREIFLKFARPQEKTQPESALQNLGINKWANRKVQQRNFFPTSDA